jgi:hypothetical protein
LSKQFAGANNPTKIIAMANQKGDLGKMIFVINIGHLPYQVACGEGDIHQERVFGYGEGGGSGDEEKKNLLIQNHISLEVTNER